MRVACIVLATAVLVAVAAAQSPEPDRPFDNIIDLDIPAEDRWVAAIKKVLDVHGWEHSFKPAIDFIDQTSPYTKEALDKLDPYLSALGDQFADHGKEMRGIYNTINARYPGKLTFGRLVLLNIFYDVTAGCTSVVASSTDRTFCAAASDSMRFPRKAPSVFANAGPQCAGPEGALIHGRNLDFPIPGLPNVTSTVHFVKNGQVLLRGVTYLGYVGILTGYSPGGWSVSVDQRDKHHWINNTVPIVENVLSFLMGGKSLGVFLRESLMSVPTYAQAIQVLNSTRLVAPVYLIVGGLTADEGAVVTREREASDSSAGSANGVWRISTGTGNYWRAQTNDDHWRTPRDTRRATINNAIQSIGREKLNMNSMRGAMRTSPVLNNWTTFVSVMSPRFDLLFCEVVHRYSTAIRSSDFVGITKIE